MINSVFEDDDYAGISPEIMALCNPEEPVPEYTDSPEPQVSKFIIHFKGEVCPFFAENRDLALASSLAATAAPGSGFICSETSYVCNGGYEAVTQISGCTAFRVSARSGKLDPGIIADYMSLHGSEKCSVISISQPTETGTIYTPGEIRDICKFAHENDMYVHMDGSRLFFATARLLRPFREQTLDAGVDITTFGGIKNGMITGEAVLIFRNEIAERYTESLIRSGIKSSENHKISLQFDCMLTDRLWRINATHANEMAEILARELLKVHGVKVINEVETNKVFAEIPPALLIKLKENFSLRIFESPAPVVRFVTGFQTTLDDILQLIKCLS